MLKKMFKTILVLSLCIGVVLPTNAAVSVSDGSAFVTKAEFAADLNNLSNRMAQLENSLDAKIDSLVSSYLTRNGIWNGAKQDLLTSTFNCESPKSEAIGYQPYTLNVTGTKHSLFNANKSGLCFVDFDWYSSLGATAQSFWGYSGVAAHRTNAKNCPDDSLVLALYYLDSSDVALTVQTLTSAKSSIQGFNGSSSVQGAFYLAAPLPPSAVKVINSFFVVKGDDYYMQFRAFVNIGFSNGGTPTTANGGLKVDLNSAYIY